MPLCCARGMCIGSPRMRMSNTCNFAEVVFFFFVVVVVVVVVVVSLGTPFPLPSFSLSYKNSSFPMPCHAVDFFFLVWPSFSALMSFTSLMSEASNISIKTAHTYHLNGVQSPINRRRGKKTPL